MALNLKNGRGNLNMKNNIFEVGSDWSWTKTNQMAGRPQADALDARASTTGVQAFSGPSFLLEHVSCRSEHCERALSLEDLTLCDPYA